MYSAHEQAWTKAGILHGDISDNSIMTAWPDDVMMGILVDWDLCKSKDMLKEPKARNGNQSVGFISYSSELSMLANHIMCREHGRLSLRSDYNIPKSLDTYLTISNLSYMLSFGTFCVTTFIICLLAS